MWPRAEEDTVQFPGLKSLSLGQAESGITVEAVCLPLIFRECLGLLNSEHFVPLKRCLDKSLLDWNPMSICKGIKSKGKSLCPCYN